jgi:ribosome maturation factor RimP
MDSMEQKIENLLTAPLLELGYLIVRIKFESGNKKTLQIMIERIDEEAINIKDCTRASKCSSLILDEADPIVEEYVLEVSSPGIDRPLIKLNDFIRFVGFKASINTKELIENRKRFKGEIIEVKDNNIVFKLDGQATIVDIDFAKILSAKLMVTP